MITAAEFAQRLQDARRTRGMSQVELAGKVNLCDKLIIKYESGQELPRMDFLEAMADALNVDLDYLFARQDMLVRAESIDVVCENPYKLHFDGEAVARAMEDTWRYAEKLKGVFT